MVLQIAQVRCIAFLKRAVGEAMFPGSFVSSLNEVRRNIDAQHVCSEFRCWQRRRAVAATKIQNLESFCDSESLDERLSTLPHAFSYARKVAFFPKCFVWIHDVVYHEVGLAAKIIAPLKIDSEIQSADWLLPQR